MDMQARAPVRGRRSKFLRTAIAATALIAGTDSPAVAQEDSAELNNGTNPTLLANTAVITYKHLDLRGNGSTGVIEPNIQLPFGNGNVSLGMKAPIAHGPIDNSFDFGDLSLTFTHVFSVNRMRGLAYTAELYLDTAARPELGYGEPVLKLAAFYAKFNQDGSILAPSLVQHIGLGEGIDGKSYSTTTFDLYYVPRLKDPRLFMTFDPAVVHDWRRDKTFGSLIVTFGRSVGRMGRGNLALFVKPQVQVGESRPASWGFDFGAKVIGF